MAFVSVFRDGIIAKEHSIACSVMAFVSVFSDGIIAKVVKVYLQKYKRRFVTDCNSTVCTMQVAGRRYWCPLLAEYSSAVFHEY